jgi:hypothetical protein
MLHQNFRFKRRRIPKCRNLAVLGAEIAFSVPYLHCLSGCLSGDGQSPATIVIAEKSDLGILKGFPNRTAGTAH